MTDRVKLHDLEACFLHHNDEGWTEVDRIEDADGVMFLCPKCYLANGGPIGTHMVICWDPSVPPEISPKPGRWNLVGTSLDDLSLQANSSSVLLTSGCQWHGFVTNGEATV
jgi:hypothetical protein